MCNRFFAASLLRSFEFDDEIRRHEFHDGGCPHQMPEAMGQKWSKRSCAIPQFNLANPV